MYQYLLTPPDQSNRVQDLGLPLVHMAFSIDENGQLRYEPLPEQCRGGLILVGAAQAPDSGPEPRQAVQAILNLCQQRNFRGVVLDLESPPTPYLSQLLQMLDQGLLRQGRGLFLPEAYSQFSNRAFLYLSSAISGGSLRKRLEEAIDAYGADRLVLSLQRVTEDFYLPAPEGRGKPMTQRELEDQIRRLEPRIFFSDDLCANYFTYMSRKSGAHFVLFDTETSLKQKRDLAQSLGISRFFLLYPEIVDFLPSLLV